MKHKVIQYLFFKQN